MSLIGHAHLFVCRVITFAGLLKDCRAMRLLVYECSFSFSFPLFLSVISQKIAKQDPTPLLLPYIILYVLHSTMCC